MSIVSEFKSWANKIGQATTKHEIPPSWVYNALMTLFELDIWFKRVPPTDQKANMLMTWSGGAIAYASETEVELTQDTTVQFKTEKDYGTISSPLNSIDFDFTDASRGVIQCAYYNAQELPPGITWLNDSDSVFSANTTFFIVLKWDGSQKVIGNLNLI